MSTHVTVVEESPEALEAYATVSIAFTVSTRFRVELKESGLAGIVLHEEPVSPPYVKDYDEGEEERPLRWRRRWDLSNWGILTAYVDQRRVGGAVVAWNTPQINMLEDRADLAVPWDIRIAPNARGQGVGTALFHQAELWAVRRGCRTLKIGNQNINVPACRFYARNGCHLGGVLLHAYAELPDEVEMLWYKELVSSEPAARQSM